MTEITHEFVLVTPEMASEWLTKNTGNRPLRPRRVDALARDMQTGKWTASNDDICFDEDGKLLNGQHRLSAITVAQVPVWIGVKRNVSRDAFRNMDTGSMRNAGDLFTMKDERHPKQLAAAARFLFNVRGFQSGVMLDMQNYVATVAEADEVLTYNPNLRDSVDRAVLTQRTFKVPVGVLAVAHFLIVEAGNDRTVVDYFFAMLETPAMEPADSSVHALRSRVQRDRDARIAVPIREHLYRIVRAWTNWAEREPVVRIAPRGRTTALVPRIAVVGTERLPQQVETELAEVTA